MANSEFVLSATQAGEVEKAMFRAGWTVEDVQRFCSTTASLHCRDLLRGHLEATPIPGALKVNLSRRPGKRHGRKPFGQLGITKAKGLVDLAVNVPKLITTDTQQKETTHVGTGIVHALAGLPLLGVVAAEHLVAYPAKIPQSFRDAGRVLFLGDVYKDDNGRLHAYLLDVTRNWPQLFSIDLDSRWPEPVAHLGD